MAVMGQLDLLHFENAEELVRAAASAWLAEIECARQTGRAYCVALSGGRIAGALFSEVTRQTNARSVWTSHVDFFWADERCVPPGDPESNYRVARESLFDPLGIAEDRIHRVRGELDPDAAARGAEAEIRRIIPPAPDGHPVLDLVLLGMGEDGHVASLFPAELEAVVSSRAVYRAVGAPKPPARRVTLGYGMLGAAREVWGLISGGGKEAALRDSLRPEGGKPLARVLRSRSHTRIFSDIRWEQ
jgi:6-phosphogluconolactonase